MERFFPEVITLAEINDDALAAAKALCESSMRLSDPDALREICEKLRVLSDDSDSPGIDLQYMRALFNLSLLACDEAVIRRMEGLCSRRSDPRLAAIFADLHTDCPLDQSIVARGKEYSRERYFDAVKNSDSTETLLRDSPYIGDFVEPYVGEIYHYTALPAVVNIIRGGELWATQCDFLNDTEERRYITNFLSSKRYDSVRDSIVRALESDSYSPHNDDPLGRVVSEMNRDTFIISFSKDQDNLTLWSGYTNKCGFNIGFDSLGLFYRNSLGEYRTGADCMVGGSVCYKPCDRPCEELDGMTDSIVRDSKRFGLTPLQTDRVVAAHLMYAGLFLKSNSMAAENEYRLIYMPVDRTAINIRCKGSIPIPYTVYRDENLIRGSIRSITIGPTNEAGITTKGINYLVSSTPGIDGGVRISKSRVSLRY